jgi:hypothetical protein
VLSVAAYDDPTIPRPDEANGTGGLALVGRLATA